MKHSVLKCAFTFSPGLFEVTEKMNTFWAEFSKGQKDHWAFSSPGKTVSCWKWRYWKIMPLLWLLTSLKSVAFDFINEGWSIISLNLHAGLFLKYNPTSGLGQPAIGLITCKGLVKGVKYPVVALSTSLITLTEVHKREKEWLRKPDLTLKGN